MNFADTLAKSNIHTVVLGTRGFEQGVEAGGGGAKAEKEKEERSQGNNTT
jgi:hypothetical protein